MDFRNQEHPERTVRLAYCLNLHAADDLVQMLDVMRAVTLPLRDRLHAQKGFGVGMYLSAAFATALASGRHEHELSELARFLSSNGLAPFTYNAFPYGSFHEDGLKARVFEPTWREDERLQFTLAVARVAARLALETKAIPPGGHLSISTHSGLFGANVKTPRDLDECAEQFARAVDGLADIETETGVRMVLALEPEPRASAQNSAELSAFLARAFDIGRTVLEDERNREPERAAVLCKRHLGHCLDACHAAVEGESAPLCELTSAGFAMGKLQYSNALVVESPQTNVAGLEALLALDEPRYLHQVTGHGARTMRATDLPELRSALTSSDRDAWLACDRLVCHFHVPVDLASAGRGLTTTRSYADALLSGVLADTSRWTTRDLHLEIETYTWDVLAPTVRGSGQLVDGLEREYRHVIGLLERAGWHPTA